MFIKRSTTLPYFTDWELNVKPHIGVGGASCEVYCDGKRIGWKILDRDEHFPVTGSKVE